MTESPQNLYAKNLQQSFGYPLRFPEPMPGLPSSYAENGLHIGDAGYVNDHGMFEVLFNICLSPDHDLHRARREDLTGLVGLTNFDLNKVPLIPDGISAGRAVCHGLEGPQGDHLKHTQGYVPCRFKSCSTSGAILILPAGAACQHLNKRLEEEFRKLAEKHALEWCQFAECKSLYLVTGLYKARSWYLASFHDVRPTDRIILERDNAGKYTWDSHCDYRQSSEENQHDNQTVFISGFKIEVRGWDKRTQVLVEKLSLHPRSFWSELTLQVNFLLAILVVFCQHIVSKVVFKLWDHGTHKDVDPDLSIDRVPALSQLFHPSDTINRYLLDKNPNVQVAITHDNEWLSMVKKDELSLEDMMDNGRFCAFLEENYVDSQSSDNVVYIRRKIECNNEDNNQRKSALSPKTFFGSTVPDDIRQLAITCMRAENIGTCLRRMPIGFYVIIQFNETRRRSKCKPASLCGSLIVEWDDEIMFPTDLITKVQFSIISSFEFEPMLGNGEMLCMFETTMGKLTEGGSTYLLSSSRREGNPSYCPSLLITLEERRFDSFSDSGLNLGFKDGLSVEAEVTDKGHKALRHYHNGEGMEKLLESIECFKHALRLCPPNHECHAAAVFNHATASFINAQVHGTISDLDVAIDFYRKALVLRPGRHPDRPGTLLHLAQTLCARHGKLQCDAAIADEIMRLTTEIKMTCSESSYEYRAADLVVQTFKRYRVWASGKLPELDEWVSEVDRSARMLPDWHFDRPNRLINFSIALRKRFELTGRLDHLGKSISVMEEILELVPDGHFEKPWTLASLGDALCARFVQCGDVADLARSICMIQHAVKLAPDGHFDRPWMLASLGDALRVHFLQHGDVADLDDSIAMIEDAVKLAPDGYFDKPRVLVALGDALRVRFVQHGNVADLDDSITMIEDAVELVVDGHFDKPWVLVALGDALCMRFVQRGDIADLIRSISVVDSRKLQWGSSRARSYKLISHDSEVTKQTAMAKQEMTSPQELYRAHGASEEGGRTALFPPGLLSDGKNYFMNSVLQGLIATQYLQLFLHFQPVPITIQPRFLPSVLPRFPAAKGHGLAHSIGHQLVAILQTAWDIQSNRKRENINPRYLWSALGGKSNQYLDSWQQDAHKFLCQILDALRVEIDIIKQQPLPQKEPSKRWPLSRHPDPTTLPSRARNEGDTLSLVDLLFGGKLASILVCQMCKHVSYTYEDFKNISLSMKPEGVPQQCSPSVPVMSLRDSNLDSPEVDDNSEVDSSPEVTDDPEASDAPEVNDSPRRRMDLVDHTVEDDTALHEPPPPEPGTTLTPGDPPLHMPHQDPITIAAPEKVNGKERMDKDESWAGTGRRISVSVGLTKQPKGEQKAKKGTSLSAPLKPADGSNSLHHSGPSAPGVAVDAASVTSASSTPRPEESLGLTNEKLQAQLTSDRQSAIPLQRSANSPSGPSVPRFPLISCPSSPSVHPETSKPPRHGAPELSTELTDIKECLRLFTSVEGGKTIRCYRCWKMANGLCKPRAKRSAQEPDSDSKDEGADAKTNGERLPSDLTPAIPVVAPSISASPSRSTTSLSDTQISPNTPPTPTQNALTVPFMPPTAPESPISVHTARPPPMRGDTIAPTLTQTSATIKYSWRASLNMPSYQHRQHGFRGGNIDIESGYLADSEMPLQKPSLLAPSGVPHSQQFPLRPAYKRYLIVTPPPILVVHLKRFQQLSKSATGFKKLDNYVSFPEYLDLAPYLAPKRADYFGSKVVVPCMYRLYAVVVHIGNMLDGHYITYTAIPPSPFEAEVTRPESEEQHRSSNHPAPRDWVFTSDTIVRLSSLEEVLKSKAYICMYERI